MSPHIPESDWKLFRKLRDVALDRYCERVLGEVEAIRATSGKSWHQRYLDVFNLLRTRDSDLADAFNAYSRSTAIIQLTLIRRLELLGDQEFQQFSGETRNTVETILGRGRV
jgi:hypothetical protein